MMTKEKFSEERLKELIALVNQLTPEEAGFILRFAGGAQEKTCPVCGKTFIGHKKQKHCSSRCSSLACKRRKYQKMKQAKLNEEKKDGESEVK